MSSEPNKYQNDMFKIHSGDHPLGEKGEQTSESRVAASSATRYGAGWSKEELLVVILAQEPKTINELAVELNREPGAIDAIKTYTRKALLYPQQFLGPDGYRNPRYGVYWRIVDILDNEGISAWEASAKEQIAKLLKGTKTRKAKDAHYRARNT
jgi:hypothetical protein